MPPGKNRIPLALRGRVGTIDPDRIATTGPLSEPTIPVSPQAAGPAVPEREIGPATGSGVLWHARGLEMAACPAKLADSGGRTPSNALSTSTPSWIRSTRWRRQQPPRPERDGSIISASGGQGRGVVWVDHLQKGGGARRWRTRWRVPSTTPTLHSQRAQPLGTVVQAVPGNPHWTRVGTDCPNPPA